MKKLYVVGLLVMTTSLAGCTFNSPKIFEVATGTIAELTGEFSGAIELTGNTEVTGYGEPTEILSGLGTDEVQNSIDSGVVPLVAGSDTVTIEQSGAVVEVKTLIDERKTQAQDETKLTEEDIGLFEKVIQKLQDMGK